MVANINSIIRDPNLRNTIYYLWDLYDASKNAKYPNGRYVPNVNDCVIDFVNGVVTYYYVSEVLDVAPYTFKLKPLESTSTSEDQDANLLLGFGPLVASEANRIFVDKTVTPNTLVFGNNEHTYGSTASYVVVFRIGNGTDQEIVSGYFDTDGNLTSPRIPLELALTDTVNNITIKIPKSAYAIIPLFHGEKVYAVVYDDVGKPLSINHYIISESSVIREPTLTYKTITGIELTSPFLSDSEADTIECDLNLPVADLNLRCKVNYADGTHKMVDIDGTKTIISGLGSYVATQLGQVKGLVLFYTLSSDEVSTNLANGYSKTMVKQYVVKTVEVNESYYVKLFVVPRWISSVYGYRLEYYLYDLNRKTVTDVTSFIEYNTNSQSYNGLAYNQVQTLSVAIDLQNVSPDYKSDYRHTQLFTITLIKNGDTSGLQTAYRIGYNIGSTEYGGGLYALRKETDTGLVYDLTCGIGIVGDWIKALYRNTYPLYSPTAEAVEPTPTHVRAVLHGKTKIIDISNYGNFVALGTDANAKIGDTIILQWLRIVENVTLEVATSSLLVETE